MSTIKEEGYKTFHNIIITASFNLERECQLSWELLGYLAYPLLKNNNKKMDKKMPAIVMIHELWGLNQSFANPSGDNYAPNEDADAWQ